MSEKTNYEPKDLQEQHARWTVEFGAARKALEKWQKRGDDIDAEFRNEATAAAAGIDADASNTRLPLFTSDIVTIIAMLYGQVPKADVARKFGDADDDLGRVSGIVLQRCLNSEITKEGDNYAVALGCVLMDFFLPGFGNALARYVPGEIKTENVEAEFDASGRQVVEAYTKESRPNEDVEIDYKHWKDWLWGPAKVLHEVPWWAHRNQMTRQQLVDRFGKTGELVPLKKRQDGSDDPWSRAEVWEIWERDGKRVYWFCESYPSLLDMKDDPLGLAGFYPFPRPLVANLTTSKVVPRPYYALHQDEYKRINGLMSRIRELEDAIRVSGVYDAQQEELPQMLQPQGRGRLIPVKNWNKLQGNGGIKGSVEFFPLEVVVGTLSVLQQQLTNAIDLLHQTTGFSDIMRGEATQAGATATEQRIKARTGSVRVQRLKDQIAEFATNLLKVKAEIICKHFTPETIKARANVGFMPEADQLLADEAIALLKSDFACYRIEVKPESVAMADFAAQKAERTEFLETFTAYFQAVAPFAMQVPGAMEELLEIAKWVASGIRGASQVEGIFDRMIAKAKAAAEQARNNPQQQANPQLEAERAKQQTVQLKAGLDMQKDIKKAELAQQTKMVEVQADAMREANQKEQNVQEFAQRAQISAAARAMAPQKPGGAP